MSERKASMGDKVYRGDVVKFIRDNISLDTFMKRTVKTADEACWDLCDKLNFVPAIEEKPEPRWIPVTERLPEESGLYQVTDMQGDVVRYVFNVSESSEEYWRRCVKAWMPLPEPYKGVAE